MKPDKNMLQQLQHDNKLRPTPPNKLPIPPEQELRELYETNLFTTIQIGRKFHVTSTTVGKWLKSYGVKLRPAGIGLKARGIRKPSKQVLYKMIHSRHLTYAQIAKHYDVDPSAIQYWLDNYNLPRSISWMERHSEPMILNEMIELYKSGASLNEIGYKFGRKSRPLVAELFRRNGIEMRKDGFQGGRRFACIDGHQVRSLYEMRVDNWLHEHNIDHEYDPSIPGESQLKADFFANGWYIEVWGVNGNSKYNEKKRRKQNIYRTHKVPLIEIPCHSFAIARNDLWIRKLQKVRETPI